jgi:hypothetical protein
MTSGDIVWIFSEQCYGEVIAYGAHVSKVRYTKDKTMFETFMENEDFSLIEEVKYPEYWEEEEE